MVKSKKAEEIKDEANDQATVAPKPKNKKKLFIILGVVAAVVIAAVVGFLIWHESPTFCNSLCHTPMDPYVDTYSQEADTTGTDKWGNEVSNTSSMLAVTHAAAGLSCLDCHQPTLGEQITELFECISGTYELEPNSVYTDGVLYERGAATLTEASGVENDELCLRDGCHDDTTLAISSRDDLEAVTASLVRNPHAFNGNDGHDKSFFDNLNCTDCHKAHRASVNYCTTCHSDSPLLDGWLTVAQSKKLENTATEK